MLFISTIGVLAKYCLIVARLASRCAIRTSKCSGEKGLSMQAYAPSSTPSMRRLTMILLSRSSYQVILLVFACFLLASSKKGGTSNPACRGTDTVLVTPPAAFDINSIKDTYADVADFTWCTKWGSYNVHDPLIKKFGEY